MIRKLLIVAASALARAKMPTPTVARTMWTRPSAVSSAVLSPTGVRRAASSRHSTTGVITTPATVRR